MAIERRALLRGGAIAYDRSFLSVEAADRLLERLLEELDWEEREIVLFGKRILQPRLVAWAGDVPYRYSGQTLPVRSFPGALRDVTGRVRACADTPFNHVLLNRYRDGNDSMGFHADDEVELGESPTVATVSLGAPRRFVLAARRGKEQLDHVLEHGSLLVMEPPCQANYRHAIPKDRRASGERVSLTFRHVHVPPTP